MVLVAKEAPRSKVVGGAKDEVDATRSSRSR
jgi:hypothetical protein